MSKGDKTRFVCGSCGHASGKWLGQCPGCGGWHTFVEEMMLPKGPGRRPMIEGGSRPVALCRAGQDDEQGRWSTEIAEMDRVLGGGLVPGGIVLLGGEPGIGKSTLLLQMLCRFARGGRKILYVSGEESVSQIRIRADRLGLLPEGLMVVNEIDLDCIARHIDETAPDILAVDSVQTIFCRDMTSAPGSVSQVREAAERLIQIAKPRNMPVFLVGHVTKEGTLAGPRVLEHLVDTVITFEGDRTQSFRIVRAVKNRFGPTHEIGIFEMTGSGLREVENPSEVFFHLGPRDVPGSVLFPCMEGTRPLLLEIQALVSASQLAMPRRTATGLDTSRTGMLLAVAEKHLGTPLYDRDVFVNVAGGVKVAEPAADLAVVLAVVSSLRGVPVGRRTAAFGETGLTGEVRAVVRGDLRLAELARLGVERAIVPGMGIERLGVHGQVKLIPVERIEEAVDAALS